ncbi:hypothetical protein JRQ81_010068 [Phrynocephalus forsythii]|uniref:Uncharacterized protein n=1 Tax=Phrynocephalus forsythii TaxID=171643 RepID=A0A9Q0X8S0_9SAUR|nr:hypothetical protein JRQ81_010068 [Phrynocephalus forsythii]
MSHLPSSVEETVKQRARDGKMRREEGADPQPEEKRLKLGDEGTRKEAAGEGGGGGGGGGQQEESDRMPCLNREESGTQTDGEGQTVRFTTEWQVEIDCACFHRFNSIGEALSTLKC